MRVVKFQDMRKQIVRQLAGEIDAANLEAEIVVQLACFHDWVRVERLITVAFVAVRGGVRYRAPAGPAIWPGRRARFRSFQAVIDLPPTAERRRE